MKKYVPFLFPAAALLIVLFLGYRWYVAQTASTQDRVVGAVEGVKIDDLSTADAKKFQQAAKDLPMIELKGSGEVSGQVRYEIKDGKVTFSVMAELPELQAASGFYQVWLKQAGSESASKAFVLESNKGGYMGSAMVSADLLPLEVIVSRETKNDAQMETVVLSGTIPAAIKK